MCAREHHCAAATNNDSTPRKGATVTFKMNIKPDSSVVMSPTPLDGTLPIALARFDCQAVPGAACARRKDNKTLATATNDR